MKISIKQFTDNNINYYEWIAIYLDNNVNSVYRLSNKSIFSEVYNAQQYNLAIQSYKQSSTYTYTIKK